MSEKRRSTVSDRDDAQGSERGDARRTERGYAPLPLVGAVVVVAVSLGGAALTIAAALAFTIEETLGPHGWLSVPLPMMVTLLVLGALAGLRHRAIAGPAAALLGLACTVAIVSGFFDGGYFDVRLSGGLRAYQMLLVTSLFGLGAVAFVRLRHVLRSRPR